VRREGTDGRRCDRGAGHRAAGGRAGRDRDEGGRRGLRCGACVAGSAGGDVGIAAGELTMWRDILADALRNVRLHWLRMLLTGSGIAWGIALFVVLTAIGSAVQGFYQEKMESIGRKAVFVFPASVAKQR